MKTVIKSACAALLVCATSTTALAQHQGDGHFAGRGVHGRAMHGMRPALDLAGITLTDDQKSRIHDIMQSARPDPQHRASAENARHKLAEALRAPGAVDKDKLASLEKQVTDDYANKLAKMVDTTLAIRAVLTPAQLEQVADNEQKIGKLRKEIRDIVRPGTDGHSEAH